MPDITSEFTSSRELWEFVLSFEDGTLPAAAWNERTVAAVAVWYLSMHPVDEAVARLETAVQRNRRRFHRRMGAMHQGAGDLASLWPRILQYVLTTAAQQDPLPLVNRLMREGGTVLGSRVA